MSSQTTLLTGQWDEDGTLYRFYVYSAAVWPWVFMRTGAPHPTAVQCISTSSRSCRYRSTSAVATGATPTGCTGCQGREVHRALTYDMTAPAIVARAGFGVRRLDRGGTV